MSNNWLILDFGKLNKNSVNKDRSILGAGILIDFGDANTDMNRQLTGSGNTHYACIFKVGRMKVFNNNTRIYYHAFINPFFYFSMLCDNFSVLSGGDVRLMKQEFMGNYQCGTFYIEKRLPGNLNFCLGFFAKEDVGFLLSLSAGFPTLK
jgi:hypothetical protein